MEKTTKRRVERINKHRERGEEPKRTSKAVPIDAYKNRESVQPVPDAKPKLEGNKVMRERVSIAQLRKASNSET